MKNRNCKFRTFSLKRYFTRLSCIRVLLSILIVCTGIMLYFNYNFVFDNSEVIIDLSKNYFQTSDQFSKREFLVDTDKCQIPEMDPWDQGILSLYHIVQPTDCGLNNLTYVEDQTVVINEVTLRSMGYQSLNDINCCYHTIHRVEQSEDNFDKNADSLFRHSSVCYPMEEITRPHFAFIKVTCTVDLFLFSKTIYKNFHVVAMLQNAKTSPGERDSISEKVTFWEECAANSEAKGNLSCKNFWENGPPPNVLIIGIDSTSRLNFHRHLTKTKAVLEKKIGAVELTGYTKVGLNTMPNFSPLMTSFSAEELKKLCFQSQWTPPDNCPFLWKDFSALNYLTAHLEDEPDFAIFNFAKTGFLRSPTDIYLRPWMLAAYREMENGAWPENCIGGQRSDQIILDYIVDLTTLSASKGVPFFITTWLTGLTHENMNSVQLMDSVLSNSLLKLNENGALDSTLLLVMSDHGYRYTDVRVSVSGWYEDKLPAIFINLAKSTNRKYPSWVEALNINAKQLTTPFDVHATLKEFLGVVKNVSRPSGQGLSLFKELPSRSCSEAGIPKEYCACSSPVAYSKNLTVVQLAAEQVVKAINSFIPEVCLPLKLKSILGSGILVNEMAPKATESALDDVVDLIISFTTAPGDFRFEALVGYSPTGKTFSIAPNLISRTSKITRGIGCITLDQISFDVYCYCKYPF